MYLANMTIAMNSAHEKMLQLNRCLKLECTVKSKLLFSEYLFNRQIASYGMLQITLQKITWASSVKHQVASEWTILKEVE